MQLLRSFPVLDAVGIEDREIQQTQAHFGIAKNPCPLGSSSGFPTRISRSLLWRRHHSVRWAAHESGGFKSLRRSNEERRIQRWG
jgi:hypothetical protein